MGQKRQSDLFTSNAHSRCAFNKLRLIDSGGVLDLLHKLCGSRR